MRNESRFSSRTIVLTIIGGLLFIILAAGLITLPSIRQRWTAPLGPGLELPTYTPTELHKTNTKTSDSLDAIANSRSTKDTSVETENPTAEIKPTETEEPTATPEPHCGGPALMYILGIGVDTKDNSYSYGLADVIRVARVDFMTPKVTVLTVPRDLWVEIPDISDHYGITHGKLNQAYFYGGPGMAYYDGPGGGPGLLARTLDKNFNLRTDHYGAVNMLTFSRIIDAVGGVNVYLPTDVDGTSTDPAEDMGYFYAGNNHLMGEDAMRFSRIRKRYSDFFRMDNQNLVICALREKLLTPKILPKIPQIIASFQGSVQTDLSLEQFGQLACLLPKIERENLLFASLPRDMFESSRVYNPQLKKETYVMEADFDMIRDYFSRFADGSWPSQPKEPTCP